MVGCFPASSTSSHLAPSNDGVATRVAGRVVGRVLYSVPRDRVEPDLLAVDLPAPTGRIAEVRFEHLADVHAGRNAEWVQDDVDLRAIGEERHVFDRQDLGDDALVAVTAGELVADADLALLADVHPNQLVDAGRKLVVVVAAEDLDVDDLAGLAVRHLERRVANLACLLAEDGAKETFFGCELGFALGRDLAHEHIAGVDFGADADDAAFVEVGENVVGEVRNIAGDLFGTELRVSGIDLVLVDVDRREHIVLDQSLGQDDRVLEVVTLPGHEGDEEVLAEGKFAVIGRGTVSEDLSLLHGFTLANAGLLVDRGVLVRALELEQAVDDLAHLLVLEGHVRPSSSVTTPSSSAMSMLAASRAARASTPVPMYGASAAMSGTA